MVKLLYLLMRVFSNTINKILSVDSAHKSPPNAVIANYTPLRCICQLLLGHGDLVFKYLL